MTESFRVWVVDHRAWIAGSVTVLAMAVLSVPALLRSMRSYGARSSVLSPLLWLVLMLAMFALASVLCGAPSWMTGIVVALFVLSVGHVLWMYVHFVLKGRSHELRSESYALQQSLIERGTASATAPASSPTTVRR